MVNASKIDLQPDPIHYWLCTPANKRIYAQSFFTAGMSAPKVAKKLRISRVLAWQWKKRWAQTGKIEPPKSPGRQPALNEGQLKWLLYRLDFQPTKYSIEAKRWTLRAISQLIHNQLGIKRSESSIQRMLKEVKWRKKIQKPRKRYSEEESLDRLRALISPPSQPTTIPIASPRRPLLG